MKSIRSNEFFKLVALNAGITDLKVAKAVYYGMIRTIARELKGKHSIKLPDWGEFYLIIQKSRKNYAVVGQEKERVLMTLPPKPMVKFSPALKVKKYFYEFGNDGTMIK